MLASPSEAMNMFCVPASNEMPQYLEAAAAERCISDHLKCVWRKINQQTPPTSGERNELGNVHRFLVSTARSKRLTPEVGSLIIRQVAGCACHTHVHGCKS